jgi:hypothetical protein
MAESFHPSAYAFFVFLVGCAGAYYAQKKGYNIYLWFAAGAIFGFLGLAGLYFYNQYYNTEKKPAKAVEPAREASSGELAFHETLNPIFQDWFYIDQEEKQLGPFPFTRFRELWNENLIQKNTFVWCDSLDEWKIVENLPNLLKRLEQ